jgi:hypothetical protein
VPGWIAFDPHEERHLKLVDEALTLFLCGQADHADDRDPGAVAIRRGQQHAGVEGRAPTTEDRVVGSVW